MLRMERRDARFSGEGRGVCVSVPYSDPPRAVATFDGEKFLLAGTQIVLAGVTFWCHAPLTPEDLDKEAAEAQKRDDELTPELPLA